MASRITLPFWPSSLNTLSWSSTNLIAVGGGDQIAILSPRLQTPGPGGTHWNSAIFRANAFTAAESGPVQPLSFANWSLGEELSLRHVVALEWSPVGQTGAALGRFGHPVLVVLSSNHVLSIWECDGKPDGSGNWQRKVVVNHPLQKHYEGLERGERETDQDYAERKQVAQRVRAFVWGGLMSALSEGDNAGSGHQLLAVSTEAGDILILRVNSPKDILDPKQKEWKVEVIQSLSINELTADFAAEERPQPAIADHLAWKYDHQTSSNDTLAFIAAGQLYSIDFEVRRSNDSCSNVTISELSPIKRHMTSQSRLTGPLKFVAGTAFLVAIGPDKVFCDDISNFESGHTYHDLDGRWDEISGLATTSIERDAHKIHLVSHLSTSMAPTTTLSLPLDSNDSSEAPAWQDAIQKSREAFSNQHKLDGHVLARTWGIAASPSTEFVATAITLLPSDSVAHIIPSDMRTTVNISREVATEDDDKVLARSSSAVSSEIILFSLQRYLETRSSDKETLLKKMLTDITPSELTATEDTLSSNSGQIIQHFRAHIVDNLEMRRSRYNILACLALEQKYINETTAIIKHLVTTILAILPQVDHSGPLSTRIKNICTILNSKLDSPEPNDAQAEASDWTETCRICNEEIDFESLNWARCIIGHQFSRCALTFLAIQEPNLTKSCGVCGAKVLNEWKIPELTVSAEQDEDVVMQNGSIEARESQHSLARILFAAFESCVYCGGKFVA